MKKSTTEPKPEVTAQFPINYLLVVNKENLSNIDAVQQMKKIKTKTKEKKKDASKLDKNNVV